MFSKAIALVSILGTADALSQNTLAQCKQGSCSQASCSLPRDRVLNENNSKAFLLWEKSGETFEDPTFKADSTSLYWTDFMSDFEMYQSYSREQIYWKRPHQLD